MKKTINKFFKHEKEEKNPIVKIEIEDRILKICPPLFQVTVHFKDGTARKENLNAHDLHKHYGKFIDNQDNLNADRVIYKEKPGM